MANLLCRPRADLHNRSDPLAVLYRNPTCNRLQVTEQFPTACSKPLPANGLPWPCRLSGRARSATHHGREIQNSNKGRIHLRRPVIRPFAFPLQSCGGPYICGNISDGQFVDRPNKCVCQFGTGPSLGQPWDLALGYDFCMGAPTKNLTRCAVLVIASATYAHTATPPSDQPRLEFEVASIRLSSPTHHGFQYMGFEAQWNGKPG